MTATPVTKYNRFGYDRDGFAKDGYNVLGYDRKGFKRDGYNDADVYKDDFPALAEGNTDPADIWSDGTTMWVSNSSVSNPKIYAYNMETKEHDEDKDFALSFWHKYKVHRHLVEWDNNVGDEDDRVCKYRYYEHLGIQDE